MKKLYKSQKNAGKVLVILSLFGAIALLIVAGFKHQTIPHYAPSAGFHVAFLSLLATCIAGNLLMDRADKKKANAKKQAA